MRHSFDRLILSASLFVFASASPALAKTLSVGPGQTYSKPCQAIAAAAAGDVIEVDAAGNYDGNTCAWSTDNLTIRGVNGRAKIDLTGVTPAQQKGIFTIAATSATIENFEFSGAAISAAAGNNGAGIRHQGLNLTVRNCYFHDNQDGILGSPSTALQGQVFIERSEFAHNGAGDGMSHNMYLGNYAKFILQSSYSHRGNVGHLVKSRAVTNAILYNRITDETGGAASYEINLPNGGTSIIVGNIIEQSATTQNGSILSYAEEGIPTGYDDKLFVVNNTFLNDRKSGLFVVDRATTPAIIQNNIFWNGGTIASQANAALTKNFESALMGDPKFVDVSSYDVHLAMGSPCIDGGLAAPISTLGSTNPTFEYVHPTSSASRTALGGAIDIGAYEFVPPTIPDMSAPPDLVGSTDMGVLPDMAMTQDLATPPDLITPIASDLGMDFPADLSTTADFDNPISDDASTHVDASTSTGSDLATTGGSSSSGCGVGGRRETRDFGWVAMLMLGSFLRKTWNRDCKGAAIRRCAAP